MSDAPTLPPLLDAAQFEAYLRRQAQREPDGGEAALIAELDGLRTFKAGVPFAAILTLLRDGQLIDHMSETVRDAWYDVDDWQHIYAPCDTRMTDEQVAALVDIIRKA